MATEHAHHFPGQGWIHSGQKGFHLLSPALWAFCWFLTPRDMICRLQTLTPSIIRFHLIHSKGRIQRKQWQPTPVLLPGNSHGWRSLVGCSPWGRKESDRTERLHFHFSLSCIEEGNGNPLQHSCLENPKDGGAWWAAVSGIAQSWTWLKRLSSSSSRVAGVPDMLERRRRWDGRREDRSD